MNFTRKLAQFSRRNALRYNSIFRPYTVLKDQINVTDSCYEVNKFVIKGN